MNIKMINPTSDKRWDEFIFNHPKGTIYHHSSWARVLQERYETNPIYYVIENEEGKITSIAPFFLTTSPLGGKRLVCLPCSEYCYPIADQENEMSALLMKAREEVKNNNVSYVEIRGFGSEGNTDSFSLKKHAYYLNHVTTLDGSAESLKAKLSRDTRYHINRGNRSNVTIRLAEKEADLIQFHRLTTNMRRRINLLPWPYRFFKSIYENIILPGYGYLLVAEVNEQIVSGGIFFCYKNRVINKFNASNPDYIQLRTNYVVMWRAIEMAFEAKYKYFDFGVTNPENTGLLKFKSHWGSVQEVMPYYYYPEISAANAVPESSLIYRTHTTINKVLPEFALKMAAELLYKRMG